MNSCGLLWTGMVNDFIYESRGSWHTSSHKRNRLEILHFSALDASSSLAWSGSLSWYPGPGLPVHHDLMTVRAWAGPHAARLCQWPGPQAAGCLGRRAAGKGSALHVTVSDRQSKPPAWSHTRRIMRLGTEYQPGRTCLWLPGLWSQLEVGAECLVNSPARPGPAWPGPGSERYLQLELVRVTVEVRRVSGLPTSLLLSRLSYKLRVGGPRVGTRTPSPRLSYGPGFVEAASGGRRRISSIHNSEWVSLSTRLAWYFGSESDSSWPPEHIESLNGSEHATGKGRVTALWPGGPQPSAALALILRASSGVVCAVVVRFLSISRGES